MSTSELQSSIADLCREIESLWALTGYKRGSPAGQKMVTTSVESGTPVLPKSGNPIRGIAGVEVRAGEPREKDSETLIYELAYGSMLPSHWSAQYWNEEEAGMRERVRLSAAALFDEFDGVPNLNERIAEALGYKHYEPEELADLVRRKEQRDFAIEKALFFTQILSDELAAAGFDPGLKAPFDGWDEIATRATERILSVAAREFNEYEVVIFLNAPMVDEGSPVPLMRVELEGVERELTIGHATDELLTKLHDSGREALLGRINTAVRLPFAVSVSAPVESYLNVYLLGALFAEKVVDCLRLLRDDDIGVMALEVFSVSAFAPTIRKTYEGYYQPELAPLVPKRFSFEIQQTPPLSEAEIERLRTLLSSYSEIRATEGLGVAFRRFRSSCERYHPSDPERLLDMAFSFEAVFLNDNENKELSFRLSLRVARFLGKTVEERRDIFETVKNLYDYRSKIAHGQTLDDMKPGDADKVRRVLAHAPKILKDALISMVSGNGPKGLVKEALRNWWRNLELS